MLRTGNEYLEGLRDGRVVYIGAERVDDVTTHPVFAEAAKTVAALYDAKSAPENRDVMSFEEGKQRYAMYYLKPRSRDDLRRRMRAHKAIGDVTYGMFGRSPDHVASFVTGMAMAPSIFDSPKYNFSANLVAYYNHLRENDIYPTYAVLPPQAARNPDFYQSRNLPVPTLQVVKEDAEGVTLSGMKMLATGAIIADEIWIGNLLPIAKGVEKQAITCAVRCNAPGLSLWSRQAIPRTAANEFDQPLTWRYDETDAMVICEDVKVPWENVFVHDDPDLSRAIYLQTPAHCFGNHQSNVRFWSKMQLLVGLAHHITQATGASEIPAVREQLGWYAAMEAQIAAMIHGQIEGYEDWPKDYVCFNRRYMYAALEWCRNGYSPLIDFLREISGGGVFQMPASVDVMNNSETKTVFERYWQTPQMDALNRMKLFRLVWDIVGTEFAGRHQQYEKFYAGATFVIRNHSYREADWAFFSGLVDKILNSYDVPAKAEELPQPLHRLIGG